MNSKINLGDQETRKAAEEEEEEAISLSNFPLNSDEPQKKDSSVTADQFNRRSSSEPSDFFEFFNDLNSDRYMSHAEDVIFGGKLVPFQKQTLKFSEDYVANISRRYCESLPELSPTRSNSSLSSSTLNSRSLDSTKLRRNRRLVMKSEVSDFHLNFLKKKSEELRVSKPRWYILMFGVVKFPPEMDLQDIRNRQFRRNPRSMFPEMDDGERVPTRRRSSWGHDLVRVLSCKSHASVAVSTSSIGRGTGIITR